MSHDIDSAFSPSYFLRNIVMKIHNGTHRPYEWFSGYAEPTIENIYKSPKDGISHKHCGLQNSWKKRTKSTIGFITERIGSKHVGTIKMMLNIQLV